MATFSPARTAARWNVSNLGFHVLAALGTPTRTIRYEDFIAAPVAGMGDLTRFTGVEPTLSFMTDAGADIGPTHTAAGQPDAISAGWTEFRRDDAWRSRFRPAARKLVTVLTLPLLTWYGYLRRPARPRAGSPDRT